MKRSCHICEKRIARDEPRCEVALRNHLLVEACWRCWFMWPDDHKTAWPDWQIRLAWFDRQQEAA